MNSFGQPIRRRTSPAFRDALFLLVVLVVAMSVRVTSAPLQAPTPPAVEPAALDSSTSSPSTDSRVLEPVSLSAFWFPAVASAPAASRTELTEIVIGLPEFPPLGTSWRLAFEIDEGPGGAPRIIVLRSGEGEAGKVEPGTPIRRRV